MLIWYLRFDDDATDDNEADYNDDYVSGGFWCFDNVAIDDDDDDSNDDNNTDDDTVNF